MYSMENMMLAWMLASADMANWKENFATRMSFFFKFFNELK